MDPPILTDEIPQENPENTSTEPVITKDTTTSED